MSRSLEANFLPQAFDEAKEKPRILFIDNNRDLTYSAKLGPERTGRYSVWEENEPARAHQRAQRVKPDLIPIADGVGLGMVSLKPWFRTRHQMTMKVRSIFDPSNSGPERERIPSELQAIG